MQCVVDVFIGTATHGRKWANREGPVSVGYMPEQVAGIDESGLPIFSQDWWINIARGPSKYRELKVVHQGVVVGRLSLVLSRSRLGLVRGQDPHWSHLGGPIVDQRLSRTEQVEVIRSLLEQLPRWASFNFVCNPDLSYADLVRSAFKQSGFDHATQLTYLRLPSDGDVLNTRKSKHKGHIKRAAKELDCVDISAKEFVQFFETNLKASKESSYSPLDTMTFLIEEAVSRGQARAIAARPNSRSQSVDHGQSSPYDAAIVYAWDNDRCYYWLSTYRIASADNSNAKPHPDATKLLAVRAMEDAQAMNLIFDADGVTTPGAENFYRNMFGLSNEQRRDVFQRETILERFYQRCRQQFKAVIAN
ncbi:MAG: hypothetical protein QOJ51_5331 [Acidobacteriaceae bacterium]|nr:hypothetical protein [Acidobacteriaceae bacterium]